MRRLTFAAVCGTLVLAACSDQSPTEPTAPPPPEQSITSCRPATHFPIVQVSGLILKVFPKGKLQLEALVRAAAVALFWETCRKTAAQRGAIDFVSFMYANSSKLTGTQTQQTTLVNLMLGGTEVPFTVPPISPNDFGVGVFDPANTTTKTLVKTRSGTALLELDPGSFDELTYLKVERKSDDQELTNFPPDKQFPPTFDYDAVNASGDHVLKNGKKALIAFCLLQSPEVQTYPANLRIGHNPVEGAPGFPFELADVVDLAAERPALYTELVGKCPALVPNSSFVIGGFGQGLPGLANAAWRTARYYLAPVQTLLLPEALHAATLAVGTLPPPAGRLPSLSPVRPVEVVSTSTSLTSSSALAIVGQGPTLTATVSPAPPTTQEGEVEFFDGTTSLGSAFLSSDGVAVFTASSLSLDEHSLTAQFLGTSSHAASTSSALVQHMVERFTDVTSFNAAIGEASGTQNFETSTEGDPVSTIINGVLNVTSTFQNLVVFLSGGDKLLFGSDATTRQAGNGRYDLTFVVPLTNNAIAFNVEGKDPNTDPAHAVVTAGAGNASFEVQNLATESDPVFLGFIASVPIASVGVIEGPEVSGTGNEETALDDFIVADVTLPLPIILLQ